MRRNVSVVSLLIVAVMVLAVSAWAVKPNPDNNPSGVDYLLWHMDDATGSTWTDSAWGGAMNGTGAATSTTGLFGGAARGIPDGGIGSPVFTSARGHEFTAECWVMWPTGTNPQAANQLLFERRGTTAVWYAKFNVMSTGGVADTVEFGAWPPAAPVGTAGAVNSGPCNFVINQWYHIAITCEHIAENNNVIKIYVTPAPAPGALIGPPILKVSTATAQNTDGTLKWPTGYSDMPVVGGTGTNFKVGGGTTGGMAGRSFDGYIDEVRYAEGAAGAGACRSTFDSFAPGIFPRVTSVAWGNTQQYNFDSSATPLNWQVIDVFPSGVGSITQAGGFTANKPGTCQVRCTDANSASDTMTVTVPVPPVLPNTASVPLLTTQQFTFATLAPPTTWIVINETVPGVGTIDQNGLFTAQLVGTCQIQAIDDQGNVGESGVITVPAPAVTPDTGLVATNGTVQFTFSNATPITWEIINASDPGVGTINASTGLFTAGTVAGTFQVRAFDNLGNTDDSGTFTVAPLAIEAKPAQIVQWQTSPFKAAPAIGNITWSVINQSTPGVGSIDPVTGVFTSLGSLGTCQVRATDTAGNVDTCDVTVVSPGAYNLAADDDTVVLYHLDERRHFINIGIDYDCWYDAVKYGQAQTIHLIGSQAANARVKSVDGNFGNAVGEFDHLTTTNSPKYLWTGLTTPNIFDNTEMTAECWVYFPAGVDIVAATQPNMIRTIMANRQGNNNWSLGAGTWNGSPATGVPGGVTFVYWAVAGTGSNQFIGSTERVFYNEIWYHVAVTYKPLGTTPETYQTDIYVTPQGDTTPNLVATNVSTSKMVTLGSGMGITESNQARKFCGYVDEVRVSKKARTVEELSWSLGGISSTACTIGEAKKNVADNTIVKLAGTVTAGFGGSCYLEEINRSAGIKIKTKDNLNLLVGDVQTIVGKMITVNGERCLQPLHYDKTANLVPALLPVGMTCKSTYGAALGLQVGATGGSGANSFGQLVRLWGKWQSAGTDAKGAYFQIDDGSNVVGADASVGIRVYYSGTLDPTNRNVAVTGILVPVIDSSSNVVPGLMPSAEIQLLD